MRISGLVLGLISSVALADFTVGVPPTTHPPQLFRLSTDGGLLASPIIDVWADGPPRSVLLYVSAVGTPGPVGLRLIPSGPSSSTFVNQPGWHEWQLPISGAGSFVLETTSADVTLKFSAFHSNYAFPSRTQVRGGLSLAGWGPCTGVVRVAGGGVPNGCAAPDDDRVAGIPYVETTLLAPGLEQQRMRLRGGELFPLTNPLSIAHMWFASLARVIGSDGGVQLPDSQGRFFGAVTGELSLDGGMSAPFVLEFASDGGNLFAAYSHRPLSDCHPVARAGFDAEESRWVGGPSGSDLVFRAELVETWPHYADLDRDGFRGATVEEWRVYQQPSPTDCDDADPARHPDAGETCNAIDDDCDGVVDGLSVRTTECERTAGLCAGSRHLAADCQAGEWLSCEAGGRYPITFRPEEVWCDGRDEDCDGVVDDSPTQVTCALRLGVCGAAPVPACVSGSWSACDYGAQYELQEATCDGLDNDCDGLTDGADSDVQAPACELSVGVCSGSTKPPSACGASGWATCTSAQYGPQFEGRESRCDGLDNDCDGLTDAQDSDLGAALCENQVGVCAGSTHVPGECDVATWHSCAISRLPNTWQAIEARCDGLDNDCDGLTDEGCAAAVAPSPVRPTPQGCGCSTSGAAEWSLLLLVLLSVRGGSRTRTPLLALRSERSVSPVPSTRT